MGTLAWSLIFFVTFIYVVALVFRTSFGPVPGHEPTEDDSAIDWYFQTVSRSMLTTFRCSFGDCSTTRGTPIFEAEGGANAMTSLMLSCFVFVASVGLFNIISAVFIERIMEYAAESSARKLRDRLKDKDRWCKNVVKLLRALLNHDRVGLPISEMMDRDVLRHISFPRLLLESVIENDEGVKKILIDLDIDPQDHAFLPDVLDSTNTGHVKTAQIIKGLGRLRGPARRCDIISVDLMVRALQMKLDDLWCWMNNVERRRSTWRSHMQGFHQS